MTFTSWGVNRTGYPEQQLAANVFEGISLKRHFRLFQHNRPVIWAALAARQKIPNCLSAAKMGHRAAREFWPPQRNLPLSLSSYLVAKKKSAEPESPAPPTLRPGFARLQLPMNQENPLGPTRYSDNDCSASGSYGVIFVFMSPAAL